MMKTGFLGRKSGGCEAVAAACACLTFAASAGAAVTPYVADSDTLALYHFDEAAGAANPGNPIVNYGSGGATLDLPNTGGPDGRDNDAGDGGGYGAAAYAGFGNSFNVLASGTGSYSAGNNAFSGGVRSSGAVTQASLQGASGAFTYEAMINISTLAEDQVILSHDGDMAGSSSGPGARGFMLRISGGLLSFYHGAGSVTAALPSVGDPHAFAASQWFHVAAAYTGAEGVAGNLTFYWTRVDSGVTQANAVGTATLATDLGASANGNWLGVGTGTRGEFRNQVKGLVDEVRISGVARGANEFLFAVPEPASLALLAMGGLIATARRTK